MQPLSRMKKTTLNLSTVTDRRKSIENICLRLLARREHSQRELLDKLALRGFTRQEVMPVIDQLVEQHWQDDQRFADSYIRQRLASGYGPLRISYELQQRGVPPIDLDEKVEELGGWQDLLLQVYGNKYDDETSLSPNEWQKRSRFLQQRGFTGASIKQLFDELKIKLYQ